MNISLIKIGNSRGIRLPKQVIDQCHIDKDLALSIEGDKIILEPVHRKPRQGWESAAIEMRKNQDDQLLIPDVFDDEDILQW